MVCGHRPIVVGPKAIRRAVIDPLLVGPVSLDCMAGGRGLFEPQCHCCSDASQNTSVVL